MTAATADDTTVNGFEVSVDEATYLVEHLRLHGLIPEVLALYNPMTWPDLTQAWKDLQHNRLTNERRILTGDGVRPEVADMVRTIAHADQTLAIRVIPLREPNVMLRTAIATRYDRFVVASRTRDIVLVQRVPASDWITATSAVLNTILGPTPPASMSEPVHLTATEAAAVSAAEPGQSTDHFLEYGVSAHNATILNACSSPDVVTELTALRRVDGITRRTKTAVTLLDTVHGRVLAWPHIGIDGRTQLTYAPMSLDRLDTALTALFATLDKQ
ncbi:ESX secretion-associated protein EspG [Mycobacteroides abscessus]|uniref:ESX secretion-associated protein EspG n=1 Tax=Mycobacteroides abscessus TaxID=36809 RepID=UPI0019D21A2E|nr:ESX secretion-associated protein EspG [Mycobacteroides abscessus]QSN49812.1 ESX secretion-associated protein EspG [Mycobacteroides abscessus subsp. abscessus]